MASYNAGLGGRKLKKVNTFKDMSRNRPSSRRASSYPPGSRASTPGLSKPAMHEDAMRRMAQTPGAGGQQSPFYGNIPNIPAPEAGTEEEAQGQAGTGGGGMNFGNLGSLGGIAGLGAGLSGIKTNFTENDLSNLEPIDTDKAYRTRFGLNTIGSDLSNIGAGFGGAAPASRAPIADAPVAGDPRVTEPDPSMFDQRQPQRSPWFGADGDPTPVEEGAEEADGRTPEERAEDEYNAGQEEEEDAEIDWGDMADTEIDLGLGGLGEGLDRIGELGEGPLDADIPPPIGSGDEDEDAGDDSDIDDWFDQQKEDHEAAWPAQEEKIKSQIARSMRRMADMQGGMGSSVAGGYAGAAAATVLGGIQVMADALAAHQREGRQMQLAWMEKKSDRNFQREMAEGDRQNRLLDSLIASGEEVTPEMINAILGPGYEGDGSEFLSGDGDGGDVPEGVTQNEEGQYMTAEGDYLFSDDGVGSMGAVQADPYAEDGESFQWYATTNREDEPGGQSYWSERNDDEYGYYRLNRETGEKIWWRAKYGGPRHPGDRSFFNREFDSRNTNDREGFRPHEDGMGIRINGYDENTQNRGEWARSRDIREAMNNIGEEYGWRKDDDDNYIWPGEPETGQNPIRYEIGYYMSWYQTVYDGALPSRQDVEDHLLDTGYISELEEGVTTLSPTGAPNA